MAMQAKSRRNRNAAPNRGDRAKIVTMERSDGHETRRERPFSLELDGSRGYDDGLRSDKWEIPVKEYML